MKITRGMLDGYQKTKRDIHAIELEIREMETAETGQASDVILDYRKGYPVVKTITGFDEKRYDSLKARLVAKKREVKLVEDWIAEIEEDHIRLVFRLYYLEGMSWKRIAKRIGRYTSADYPRLVIRDGYLKRCGVR